MCEYFNVSSMELLVENLINGVLERSTTGRKKVGHLLGQLLKRNILLRKQFDVGLKSVLQLAEILLVDIPKFWDYLGELIGEFVSCSLIIQSSKDNDLAFHDEKSITMSLKVAQNSSRQF